MNGKLKIFNTINEFNVLDKNKFLNELGNDVIFFETICIGLVSFILKITRFLILRSGQTLKVEKL